MPKYDKAKLIHTETGEEIPQGSEVPDFRGDLQKFLYVSRLPEDGKEGRIIIEANVGGEVYPSVLKARIEVPTPALKEYTAEEFRAVVQNYFGDDIDVIGDGAEMVRSVTAQMNKWLERGDGVAVYENQDLGHYKLGDKQFVSFGSSAAQLEVDTPPAQLPDTPTSINWRYALIATYKGEPLSV